MPYVIALLMFRHGSSQTGLRSFRSGSADRVRTPWQVARAALVLLCLSGPAGATAAQLLTATVTGTASTDQGQMLAGVTVTIYDTASGVQRTAVTDEDGWFVIPNVPADAEHQVSAELPGFTTARRDGVGLVPGTTQVIHFILTVAPSEIVTVSSSSEVVLDRTHSAIVQVVDDRLAHSVPLFGRNFIELATLAAGMTGNPAFPGAQGQPYWSHNVLVDGASHFSKWRSAPRAFNAGYSLEAIREVRVNTSVFSAELGEGLASVTTAATRSGTRQWHGSALLFVRHSALDGVPAFAVRKPPGGGQQFGASGGGPLPTGQTFVWGSYEGRRARDRNIVASPAAFDASVPDNQDEHLMSVRLDRQQGIRHQVAVRYNSQLFDWHHEQGGLALPGTGTRYANDVHTVLASDTWQISTAVINELRGQFARYVDVREDLDPSVFVSRAGYSIQGGTLGPLGFGANPEDSWEASNTVLLWKTGHSFRIGGGLRHTRASTASLGYGHGAYFFAGPPERFPAPFLFVQSAAPRTGAAAVAIRSTSISGFVQDDWNVRRGLTLNVGLRYDVEHVSVVPSTDIDNLQPRVGAAWNPREDGRTIVRAGVGLYAQQHLLYPIGRVELEGPDGVRLITLTPESPLWPSFPSALPTFASGAVLPAVDVHRLDPRFNTPYAIQAAAGVERLVGGTVIAAEYVRLDGRDLMSLLDANAPDSILKPAQRSVQEADATRPLTPAPGSYRKILTLGSEGRSWYRALQIKARRSTADMSAMASYTLSRADDMASYDLPEDSRNLAAEKGLAATDVRHSLAVAATTELPGSGRLLGGWRLSGIGTFRSGRPYTITWGDDRNGTTQADARPGARNTGRTGPYRTIDLALARTFPVGGAVMEARVEAFNTFNTINYDRYIGELLSPLYSKPVSAFPPRRLQLAAIVRF